MSYLSNLYELFGFISQIEFPVPVRALLFQIPAFDEVRHSILDALWSAAQQLRYNSVTGKAAFLTETLHVAEDQFVDVS